MRRVAATLGGVKFSRLTGEFALKFARDFCERGAVKFESLRIFSARVLPRSNLTQAAKFDPSNSAVNFKIFNMLGAKFFKFALAQFALQKLLKFKLATPNLPPQKVKFDA